MTYDMLLHHRRNFLFYHLFVCTFFPNSHTFAHLVNAQLIFNYKLQTVATANNTRQFVTPLSLTSLLLSSLPLSFRKIMRARANKIEKKQLQQQQQQEATVKINGKIITSIMLSNAVTSLSLFIFLSNSFLSL